MPSLTHHTMRRPSVSFAFSLSLIAALTAIPTALAQGNPVKFTSAERVPNVDGFPQGAYTAISGYFDSDKRLDIEFSSRFVGTPNPYPKSFVDVALNQGNGKFNVRPTNAGFNDPPFPDQPGADLAVDLNGDGISDLITHGSPDLVKRGLLIQLGRGDGTFTDGTLFQVDAANSSVVGALAADFDCNATMDLAAVTTNHNLIILLNDGAGKLHPAFTYSLVPGGAIAVGDINGDTLPDIVFVGNGAVTPYLSTGGGALMKGTSFSVLTAIPFIGPAIADINKDGHGDIAVPTSTGIKFLLGSSSGQLTSGTTITVSGIAALPGQNIVLADFNKDGNMDLTVAGMQIFPGSVTSSYVNVYFGKGNGTFNHPSVYSAGNGPASLLAGDFYGTGNMDLVAFANGDASLHLLRNPGNGYFQAAPVTHVNNATGIVASDFNRDDKQDVAVVNTPNCKAPCSGSVTVLPGSGSTYFNPGKTYPIGMHGAAIAAGDLNGDGIVDLVVVNAVSGDAADTSVLLGKPEGTFQPARNYRLGSLSYKIVLADMNKDGRIDLVSEDGVALGSGDGTFSAPKPFPNDLNFDTMADFAVGDVNGDGKLDVVAALGKAVGDSVQVLIGDGKGGFMLGNLIPDSFGSFITSIALGRLRPGGPLDIVYLFETGLVGESGIGQGIAGFAGDGHGGFATDFLVARGPNFGDPRESGPIVLADFNGDGKLDVGVGANGFFLVSRGNADDTFQPQQIFAANLSGRRLQNVADTFIPGGIAVADFDRDGRMDAVLASGLGVARLYNVTARSK